MGYVIGPCLQGPTERLGRWDILRVTECMGYYRYGSLELTIQLYCILEWSYQVNIQTPPVKSGARHEWRKNGSSGSFKHQSPTIHTSTDWLRAQKGKTHILVPSRIISTALFPLCSNTSILGYENISYHGYLSPISQCQVNDKRTGDVLFYMPSTIIIHDMGSSRLHLWADSDGSYLGSASVYACIITISRLLTDVKRRPSTETGTI